MRDDNKKRQDEIQEGRIVSYTNQKCRLCETPKVVMLYVSFRRFDFMLCKDCAEELKERLK